MYEVVDTQNALPSSAVGAMREVAVTILGLRQNMPYRTIMMAEMSSGVTKGNSLVYLEAFRV